MSTRRTLTVAGFALAVLAVVALWPTRPGAKSGRTEPASMETAASGSESPPRPVGDLGVAPMPSPSAGAPASPESFAESDFPIVAPLNQTGSTLARDLATVAAVLDAWRTNFPREGNPVGENADITAALSGSNRLGLGLIPKGHPAINAQGELCDRWGTPFRFHQLSGEHMEIRSAGPDRKFATEDDGRWQPVPGAP